MSPPFPLLPCGNAELPKLAVVMLLPVSNVTLARLAQPEKALFPMVVTLSGMVMSVRLAQPSKAPAPMLLTLLGMNTLFSNPLLLLYTWYRVSISVFYGTKNGTISFPLPYG